MESYPLGGASGVVVVAFPAPVLTSSPVDEATWAVQAASATTTATHANPPASGTSGTLLAVASNPAEMRSIMGGRMSASGNATKRPVSGGSTARPHCARRTLLPNGRRVATATSTLVTATRAHADAASCPNTRWVEEPSSSRPARTPTARWGTTVSRNAVSKAAARPQMRPVCVSGVNVRSRAREAD